MSIAEITKKPDRDQIPSGSNLCEYCTAKCCKYFALPIDTPENWKDFEFIRWYMVHERASIFIDEGDWYLMVHTVCKHLQDDNRCGIYETRPDICREYSTDNCEYDDDWCYDHYFETAAQIYEYAEATLPPREAQTFRTKQPPLLPIL